MFFSIFVDFCIQIELFKLFSKADKLQVVLPYNQVFSYKLRAEEITHIF